MQELKKEFILNFIEDNRWKYIVDGLKITLIVTIFAVLIGVLLGFLIAIVRTTHDKTGKLKILNVICRVYLTVIRGTPVVVQLMIIYFIIFGSVDISKVLVAIIAFGINSGAYVAEIFRSGIMSIDNGQFEAGRSLGFNYAQTMMYIIMPQAFKNVLPALFFIITKFFSLVNVGSDDFPAFTPRSYRSSNQKKMYCSNIFNRYRNTSFSFTLNLRSHIHSPSASASPRGLPG